MNSHSFALLLIAVGIVLVSTSIAGSSAKSSHRHAQCGDNEVYDPECHGAELTCADIAAGRRPRFNKLCRIECKCKPGYGRDASDECVICPVQGRY